MIGTFAKNSFITFLTRAITGIFGLLVTIIIARELGPEKQGIYSLALMFSYLLIIFTAFGINPASVFFIGKKKYPSKEIFGNNIIFNFFISIFTILIGLVIVFFFGNNFFPGIETIYLILALFLVPLILFFDLGCQVLLGLQKIKEYNSFSLFQNGLFLFLIIILLLGFHLGVQAAIYAQIISFLLVSLFLFFIAKKETEGISLKINKNYFKEVFSYGLRVQLAGVFHFLHYRIDLFLINLFINPIAVGFYYVAAKFSEVFWFLSNSTGTVLFSKLSSETDEKKIKDFTPIVCRNILFIMLLVVILFCIIGHWIITLFYSKEFLDSVQPFRILLIGTLVVSGWEILANDLAARGKPILNTYTIGISLLINVILNIIFIPRWGIVGAAWATAISYFVMLIITIVIYGKISGNSIKDIIIFQKKDINIYKNILLSLKNRKIS